jgi:hypothetical protein
MEYHAEFASPLRHLQTDGTADNTTANDSNSSSSSTTATTATASNPLTTMPLFMGFIYAGITGLVAIYALIFFMYKNREDKDRFLLVPPAGLYQKLYALIIRVFPLLMKLGHYVIFVLILIQIANVLFLVTCEDPYSLDDFGVKKDSPLLDVSKWSLLIYVWFWVASFLMKIMIHIIFPGWRKAIYELFFQYEPYDPSRNVIWAYLFIYWGPN